MPDTIERITIGSATSLVAADLTIDFSNSSVAGSLSTLVGGIQVPATGLVVSTASGVTTVTGTTALGAGVTVQFAGLDPTTANATVTALGQAPVTSQVSATVVCFAAGTHISTNRGDVTVEKLKVGDIVVTASGARLPIRWLGHRTIDCRQHPRPQEAMPVRIAAHAFGRDRPARDLLVSPGHSLCVDVLGEVLIPAISLINGTTIVQEDVESVTYWHVALERHEIILAENMPAESYLDMGNRSFFAESDVVALDTSPDTATTCTHADFCRPYHAHGALVEAVRAQLAVRAQDLGWRLEEKGLGDLHLVVDGVRCDPQVRGLTARFTVPATASKLWLVSSANVPADISASSDSRLLGVRLGALAIDDGFDAPAVLSMDDPRLSVGFHAVEQEGGKTTRWTAGRALLPSTLWEGALDDFFLRVELAQPALPHWIGPAATAPKPERIALAG